MRGLAGKAILVTGSSIGIGYAMAERLVAEGAKVLVHGRDQAEVDAAVAKLGAATVGATGDLIEPATAHALVDATVKAFGRIDGLVNNAGIYPRGAIGTTTAAFFDHVFAINTRAPLLCAEAAIQAFRLQKSGGAIVSVGSINALCGQADLTVYSMSKGALTTMTRNLADALGTERIRVNCLNVGWTFTANEDATQQREGRKPGWEKEVSPIFAPTGRLMQPEEIAAHTAFWLSEDSAPVTGQIYEAEQFPLIGRSRAQMS
ncbi:SDR family NAD(P)-dependent oxidoreductase [Bosea caraganae]|uniref:SDR family NAD(P)-dependent oxidoreductase n=1 Tax=Bosea caraganae TaxID=2763117 RepID=A0A370LC97_9HYPH|nr:SDR family oxidoreductase [Bosea caraganae]RDJ27578.1 SDR family NAD(P)-dependent oxidoreductase [Bosea caraganae]RDJ29593.1 SDR family NAD(P)-dependent oxidoreductase [Bosea caraganae]